MLQMSLSYLLCDQDSFKVKGGFILPYPHKKSLHFEGIIRASLQYNLTIYHKAK